MTVPPLSSSVATRYRDTDHAESCLLSFCPVVVFPLKLKLERSLSHSQWPLLGLRSRKRVRKACHFLNRRPWVFHIYVNVYLRVFMTIYDNILYHNELYYCVLMINY
jgi:hypothetical protein